MVASHIDRLVEVGAALRMPCSRPLSEGLFELRITLGRNTQLAAEVGERMYAAREAAGLTQRELARRMGASQATIDHPESGGVGATLTMLQRVATALGLEVNVELKPAA